MDTGRRGRHEPTTIHLAGERVIDTIRTSVWEGGPPPDREDVRRCAAYAEFMGLQARITEMEEGRMWWNPPGAPPMGQ